MVDIFVLLIDLVLASYSQLGVFLTLIFVSLIILMLILFFYSISIIIEGNFKKPILIGIIIITLGFTIDLFFPVDIKKYRDNKKLEKKYVLEEKRKAEMELFSIPPYIPSENTTSTENSPNE